MTLYQAFAAKYGSSTVLGGITNMDWGLNPEVKADPGPGSVFPQHIATVAEKPKAMISTQAVAAWLAVTGSTGALIDGTNNFIGYFAKLGADGLPASSNVHRSYTYSRGLLIPRRLNINARAFATLDVEALSYSSDGTTHPMALSDTATLPTPALDEVHHTIGKVLLGGGSPFAIGCLNSISIDFGSKAEALGCGSSLYDQHIQQPGVAPTITLRGIAGESFAASGGVPPVGTVLTNAGTKIYLRKYAVDGLGFVDDATAEHICLSIVGLAKVMSHSGSGNQRSEVNIQITTRWDGTNAPITIDTASAIA